MPCVAGDPIGSDDRTPVRRSRRDAVDTDVCALAVPALVDSSLLIPAERGPAAVNGGTSVVVPGRDADCRDARMRSFGTDTRVKPDVGGR